MPLRKRDPSAKRLPIVSPLLNRPTLSPRVRNFFLRMFFEHKWTYEDLRDNIQPGELARFDEFQRYQFHAVATVSTSVISSWEAAISTLESQGAGSPNSTSYERLNEYRLNYEKDKMEAKDIIDHFDKKLMKKRADFIAQQQKVLAVVLRQGVKMGIFFRQLTGEYPPRHPPAGFSFQDPTEAASRESIAEMTQALEALICGD
ncbi:uncharacterized protein SPSC_03815 [Sporisorium scitamineum]|uniref:Uncharacterized protein n=1 Tax=Sporisorium scitamineum TaxID=49012 RepID=A0A0F7S6W6_9BASI|nr:uncharacterized protein SPSC_03815 [Sporisorium scitamineum]CDW96615.1 hypothetical protein [Sporisorium scitamineum]